jgi:hypothetical protein
LDLRTGAVFFYLIPTLCYFQMRKSRKIRLPQTKWFSITPPSFCVGKTFYFVTKTMLLKV